MSQPFSNNTNSLNAVNVWNNYTVADDRSQILTWLSPQEPRLRHHAIQDRRVENVGEWLLETEEFRNWYNGSEGCGSDNSALFCYGDPGVGKTYICSLVIDRLCDQSKIQNAAVACFYFDFAAQTEQSSTNILGALLKQVVSGLGEVPGDIAQAYEDQKKVIGGRVPQHSDIVKMLQIISSKKRTFICLDALDECAAGHRVKILDALYQILRKSPGTRIFVTGRPYIGPEIARRLGGRVTSVSISPKRDDITRYIHTRLEEDTTPDAMDSSLEADILKKIPEDISEIFLLVSLNLDTILQESTIHCRRQKLSAMTDGLGLGGAYGATLGRIRGQGMEKSRLGMAALMWISYSERPLKVDELCHAIAVEIGSPNLNTDNVPSIGTLLACCQGLVTVDKEASTVRLIHFTLQEYLRAHPQLFGAAHSIIAETCLSYLNSGEIKALSKGPSPDPHGTPFLEYSSLYWGIHAKKDLSDYAKLLALKLFGDYDNHVSTRLLLKAQDPYSYAVDFDRCYQFSGLHCASVFGIVKIVAGLVEVEDCNINEEDCIGHTPLVWAAWDGHEAVVKILLGRDDINPDKPDRYGQTPLWCAAKKGHESLVKILLGREDVNPDRPDGYSQTPLWWAAERGHAGVVKILLGKENVSPDMPNKSCRTPLWSTARNGHERVVKMLLGREDVDPDKPDNTGQTPLCCAAWNGHEGVVKTLLGRKDIASGRPGNGGQKPLPCAAWNGQKGVMGVPLERGDVDLEKVDNYDRTPLWCASWNGHEGVVKILPGREDVDSNRPNCYGATPLCCGAKGGHEGVVKMLLRRGDVTPDKPTISGRTPLLWAASAGHEGVVKILLGRDDVNPDKSDNLGRTPLWWATKNGHTRVIALLQPPVSATPSAT